ncbi:hypothetical protein FDG2_6308 [Candidatus Protofrankia californiensis]|uniref:Uncharacterized protein n=1 Tax=Candidatus Protofrankia californiensis TaxID=1839754 RepID=A0A1C3PGQ1_9ACTN|nr:hypothetical protein FDG2_6308 [Candidatus Protofrankia californiensis]
MTGPDRYAAVFVLPVCVWCRHLWVAHWADDGCQASTGRGRVCGCREPPPDHPDNDQDHDDHGQEEQAA